MKKKISIKSLSIILLSLAILSMLIIVSHQNNQLDNLINKTGKSEIIENNANVMVEKKTPDAEPLSKKRRLQYEKAIDQLKTQINKIQTIKGTSKKQDKLQSENIKRTDLKKIGQSDEDDDAISTVISNSVSADFDSLYKPFLNELNLSKEDQEKLYALLLVRVGNIYQNNLNLMNGTSIAEISKQNEITEKNYNEGVNRILEDVNYEKYQTFEKTIIERRLIDNLKIYFNESDQLDNEKKENLIQLLYEQRHETYTLYPEDYLQLIFYATNDQEKEQYINEFKARNDELYNRYLTSAKDILSETQLKAFNNILEDQKVMNDMSFKYFLQW